MDPGQLMQVGFVGFRAAKTLLSAVELELFTVLSGRRMTGEELRVALGLNARAIPDFTDALVALNLLHRDGDGAEATYYNTPEGAAFLDKNSPSYMGGILEMANARLYEMWGRLTEGLKTGRPQNETRDGGESLFAKLYEDPERLAQFMDGMEGISAPNFSCLAEKVDFGKYRTLCDIGGATGLLYPCGPISGAHVQDL